MITFTQALPYASLGFSLVAVGLSITNSKTKASKKDLATVDKKVDESNEIAKETNALIKDMSSHINGMVGKTTTESKTTESPVEKEVKTTTVKTEKTTPKADAKKAS